MSLFHTSFAAEQSKFGPWMAGTLFQLCSREAVKQKNWTAKEPNVVITHSYRVI